MSTSVIEIIMHHPWPFLAWMLPIFGAMMMPILDRVSHKVRDYGAVVFAFSAVVCAAMMMIPLSITVKMHQRYQAMTALLPVPVVLTSRLAV